MQLMCSSLPGLLLFSVFGFLPALFEVLLPIVGPRPPEVIDESFVGWDELRRSAVGTVDDCALHAALDKCISRVFVVDARLPIPRRHFVKRPLERLRIINRRVDGDLLAVGTRREYFDGLQLITELEHRVRQSPRNDVLRPRDQRVAVPESDGLAEPLRNLLDVFLTDKDLAQEVVRNAG